jgi:hypothetical protein
MRRKCSYPYLAQYAEISSRAYYEFIKQNSPDCPFSYIQKSLSENYNNNSKLEMSMRNIILSTKKDKKKHYLVQRSKNTNSNREGDRAFKSQLLRFNRIDNRKLLTIRDKTCFLLSTTGDNDGKTYLCPYGNDGKSDKCRWAYKYKRSFIRHLKGHNWSQKRINNFFSNPSAHVYPGKESLISCLKCNPINQL